MQPFFHWLAGNPYILLFAVVLAAVLLGRAKVAGYALGAVASAVVVGAAVSAAGTAFGVRLGVDAGARSLFYLLFMYALGLRIGPSLAHALRGDGPKLVALALVCSALGIAAALLLANLWDLPIGALGGLVAGSLTAAAAIVSAEEALHQGLVALPRGMSAADVSAMIAVSYALTVLWGTVGLLVVCRYLPRWWGIDVREAAKRCEDQLGVANVDDAGLTGLRPLTVRALRLVNGGLAGLTARQFAQRHPHLKLLDVLRIAPARLATADSETEAALGSAPMALAAAGVQSMTLLRDAAPSGPARLERTLLPETQYVKLGAADDVVFRQGDVVIVGGRLEDMAATVALIGPEVADPTAVNISLDYAQIVITQPAVIGRGLDELRAADYAGQVAIHHIERGGAPLPLGAHLKLQRLDVLFVAGVKSAVEKIAAQAGEVARSNPAAELATLAIGLILGLALGAVTLPFGASQVGLGNGPGLLVAGMIVAALSPHAGFLGATPDAARNLLEELGLVAFIAIVGIEAGAYLATRLPGDLAVKILVTGFVVSTIPPIAAWAIGHHLMKLNPAVLMGAIAGARSHGAPARNAACELGSSVPWIGFPVAHAISTLAVTVMGYVAMAASR